MGAVFGGPVTDHPILPVAPARYRASHGRPLASARPARIRWGVGVVSDLVGAGQTPGVAPAPRCICPAVDLSSYDGAPDPPVMRGYDPDCPIHGVDGTRPDRLAYPSPRWPAS